MFSSSRGTQVESVEEGQSDDVVKEEPSSSMKPIIDKCKIWYKTLKGNPIFSEEIWRLEQQSSEERGDYGLPPQRTALPGRGSSARESRSSVFIDSGY